MNRRKLLQMAALAPLFSLRLPRSVNISAGALSPALPCKCISVLLHGLFFLEYQGSILVAAAPKTLKKEHKSYFRDHNGVLEKLSGVPNVSDLTASTPVMPDTYPSAMLRFSKKEVGIRGNFIDGNATDKYAWILKLPLPNKILPLRTGPFATFQPDPIDGKVAKSIIKSHGSQTKVSVITWLQYDLDNDADFTTRSFYSEHNHRPNYDEVNTVLAEVQTNITSAFDLQIAKKKVDPYLCDDSTILPPELDQKDETALADLLEGQACYTGPLSIDSVEVASCPQFGVMK